MGSWIYELQQYSDGGKLVEAYKEVDETLQNSLGIDDDEKDFIVYIEDNYSVSFGSILLVKMSQAMVDYTLDNPKKDLLSFWSRKIVEEQYQLKNYAFQATAKDLHNAFLTELNINGKRQSGALGKNAAEDVKNLFQGFSDRFRSLKFTIEQYDPTLKSDKYLLKNYNKVFNLFDKGIDFVINSLQVFKERLVSAKIFVRASEFFDGTFFDLMLKFVEAHITFFLRLKKFLKTIQSISNKGFAFLCGIINGIIEFLAGVIDIVFVIIEGIVYGIFESRDQIMLDYLLLRESLENFAVKLIDEPDFLVKHIEMAINNYVDKRYKDDKLTDYQIAYFTGEDIIIVVDVIVSLVSVVKGVARFAKELPNLTKWLKSVVKNQFERFRKLIDYKNYINVLEHSIYDNPDFRGKYELNKIQDIKRIRADLKRLGITLRLVAYKDNKTRKLFEKMYFNMDVHVRKSGETHGMFVPKSGYSDWLRYDLQGPSMYLLKNGSAYTYAHELKHAELWYFMNKKYPELSKTYKKITSRLHEEYVLSKLIQSQRWDKKNLLIDLNTINKKHRIPNGLPPVNLEYFKNWQLSQHIKFE